MGLSYSRYLGDGSTTDYAINFTLGYIKKTDVYVYVDDVEVTYTWVNDGMIRLDAAPAAGEAILIRRIIDTSVLAHDYQDGAVVIEKHLDESNKQVIMATHAVEDGFINFADDGITTDINMNTNSIHNLAEPVDDNDATTKVYVDDILGNAVVAEDSAIAAAASELASGISETNSAASEAAAAISETNAVVAADAAVPAAATAVASATAAEAAEAAAVPAAATAVEKADIAVAAEASATLSEGLAEQWASEEEDVVVADGKYSAYHWANKSQEIANAGASAITVNTDTFNGILTSAENDTQKALAVIDDHKHDADYLGIHTKADDSDLLDGHDSAYFEGITGSTFVAEGAISAAGKAVVLNSNGTVSVVTTGTAVPFEASDNASPSPTNSSSISIVNIDASSFILVFSDVDNGSRGTMCIGTVANDTITYGSLFVFYSGEIRDSSIAKVDTNLFCLAYGDADDGTHGMTLMVTLSGSTLVFSSAVVYNSGVTYTPEVVVFDSTHIGIAYTDSSDSSYLNFIVGEVSGSSITLGAEATLIADFTASHSVCTLSSTSLFFAGSHDDCGIAIISGTTVSSVTLDSTFSGYIDKPSVCKIDSTHVLLTYNEYYTTDYTSGVVVTVAGSTLSYGTIYQLMAIDFHLSSGVMLIDSTHAVFSYTAPDTYYINCFIITISGTVLSVGTTYTSLSVAAYRNNLSALTPTSFVSGHILTPSPYRAVAVLFHFGDVDTDVGDFVGYSKGSASDGDSVGVSVKYSLDDNQTSLTKDTDYYLDAYGDLSTEAIGYPKAGVAISETKLIVGV